MILHSDANCFYASVEMVENPTLQGKAIAVCGDPAQRHGIVLTASYPAKRRGVKTGMANWQALQTCPDLIIVKPHYDLYLKYSKLLRHIYQRHSNNVEPFGMDESWISLPYDEKTAIEIAESIRQTVKDETGLTVSIGVSFTKALAKLGSDMKKPDGMTVLSRSNFREKCWCLPVSDLLYVGPRTTKKMRDLAILTIGDLANAPADVIRRKFGRNGEMLQAFANGSDCFPVAPADYTPLPQSIGHGATCTRDLEDNDSVWFALIELAQDVGHRLMSNHCKAQTVRLCVKDNTFAYQEYSAKINYPTQSPLVIAQAAFDQFILCYAWQNPVRALTITASQLQDEKQPEQIDIFGDYLKQERLNRLDQAIDSIRNRFGRDIICNGCVYAKKTSLATDKCESVKMPGMMYR